MLPLGGVYFVFDDFPVKNTTLKPATPTPKNGRLTLAHYPTKRKEEQAMEIQPKLEYHTMVNYYNNQTDFFPQSILFPLFSSKIDPGISCVYSPPEKKLNISAGYTSRYSGASNLNLVVNLTLCTDYFFCEQLQSFLCLQLIQ